MCIRDRFYRDLTGELKVQKEEEERVARDYVNPMFDSYSQNEQPQEDQTHPQQFWRCLLYTSMLQNISMLTL